jgi:branched-chain amino acid transport system substrate-binding protein
MKRQNLLHPYRLIIVSALIVSGAFGDGCETRKEPVKVGFVGGLTGRHSDLGTAGRNGVLLAVEALNAEGGIDGRPVELITRDDRQDPEKAVQADKELIREGVVAIIGHMTSAMSMAALPLMNKEKMPMISPTTSTNQLTGKDDYFFRITDPNKAETDHLARHAYERMGLKRLSAIYDLSNRAFSEGYYQNFKAALERMGGGMAHVETFSSKPGADFQENIAALRRQDADGLLIVAGALDTAMICQQIRKAGSKMPILSSGWAMTEDLIYQGGSAVEEVVFSHLIDKESRDKGYLDFKKRFKERFGHEPSFAAIHGYVAARVLFQALSSTTDPEKLKKVLLDGKTIHSIVGDFEIDQYGDPKRPRYLTIVRNGRFKTLD